MKIYSISQLTKEEKENILDKHRTLYDGYRTIHPNISNMQDLYVQDFANDKNGITVTNKGDVKNYTNYKINESEISEKEVCSECGGGMYEGECMECGYKNEEVSEDYRDELSGDELEKEFYEEKKVCSECGGGMYEGECMECGYKMESIEDIEDINNDNEFDYVKEQMLSPINQMKNAKEPYDFDSGGPLQEYDEMESAFDEFDFIEDDEVEEPLPNFDFENNEDEMKEDWSEVEEDIKESFVNEKNKINEMFLRLSKFN